MERVRDQIFGDLGTVGVGGIDEIDAELDAPPEHPDGSVAVAGGAEDAFAGDAHGAEAHPVHLLVADSQQTGGIRRSVVAHRSITPSRFRLRRDLPPLRPVHHISGEV
jgi:hypothetical protein